LRGDTEGRTISALSSVAVLVRYSRLLPALGALGCSSSPSLPDDVQWISEHFVYHARADDDSVCAGIEDTLERHFAAMQSYLGFSWPAGRAIHYYKFRNELDFTENQPCPAEASGCHEAGRIFTAQPLHEHELIHAYLDPLGLPPPLLLEGVAQALGCQGYASLAGSAPPDSWRIARRQDAYVTGPWLVAHLLRKYGPAPFLQLYQGRWFDATSDELARRFEAVYGASIDEVWNDAASSTVPEVGCIFAWECAAPAALPDAPIDVASRCDRADRYRSFTLAENALVDMTAEPQFAYLHACANTPPAPLAELPEGLAMIGQALLELGSGSYFVQADTATTLSARAPAGSPLGDDCTQPPPLKLDALPAAPRLLANRRASERFFRFSVPSGADVWAFPKDETDTAEICNSCEDTQCVPAGSAQAQTGGPDFALKLGPAAQARGFADITLQIVSSSGTP
jgi:hypothetical protein